MNYWAVVLALLINIWPIGFCLGNTLTYGPGNPITAIAKANKLKDKAQKLIENGQYADAAQIYRILSEEYGLEEEELLLNQAHLLYLANKPDEATEVYRQTTVSAKNKVIAAKAYNQLGYLAGQNTEEPEKSLRESLSLFKEALRKDYNNNTARRNYEIAYLKLYKPQRDNKTKPEQDNTEEEDKNKKDEQPKLEPTEFAKQQKSKADALIAQGNYGEAYDLLDKASMADSSVLYYQGYISRLKEISEIAE